MCGVSSVFVIFPVKNHTEPSGVQIVQIRFSARMFIYLAYSGSNHIECLDGKIISHHGMYGCVIADIQHDNGYMLMVVKSTFHIGSIRTVFHQKGCRVNNLLRPLDADAD